MGRDLESPMTMMEWMTTTALRLMDLQWDLLHVGLDQVRAGQAYWAGIMKYMDEFLDPYWIAQNAFFRTERDKLAKIPPWESVKDYLELLQFNLQVAEKGGASTLKRANDYHLQSASKGILAWIGMMLDLDGRPLRGHVSKEAGLLEKVVFTYPQAILDIQSEYGFHFDRPGFVKTAETDRFLLYQVLPQASGVKVRDDGKPVLIVHPYVLGPNILCFLPAERKSYVHAFADQGTPTYVRIMKDIRTTPAVQVMTGEDDARDTLGFCRALFEKHGRPVTMNGFCQGGFVVMAELLTGRFKGLVDALITCVAPMDGTRSRSLVEYLEHLPPRFRDLGYAVKTLPSGNQVVDGKVMSWVYKLKSMEREAPIYSFFRDLAMFDAPDGRDVRITKTAAALNHWLIYDRNDLPEAVTQMSFRSYTIPIDADGTLPVTLFGEKLNIKRLSSDGIRVLICYAERDDLVDRETALAPLDFIDAEVTMFPKGHGAIATSWSHPESECALHKRFGKQNLRGPVRFHLDLEAGV